MDVLIQGYTESKTGDLLERNRIIDYLHKRNYVNSSEPLRRLLNEKIRPEWFDWLQSDSAPACYVVYTDFHTGKKITVSPKDYGVDRERFIEATLASASVPILMEPTYIDGYACFDGGVRDVLPIERAIELGAERIIPIFLDPEEMEKTETDYRNIKEIALRTVVICMDEIIRNDFQQAKYLQNAAAFKKELWEKLGRSRRNRKKLKELCENEEFSELFGPGRVVIDILDGLRPDQLMTYDMLTFDPETMRRWLAWGEEKAGEVVIKNPFAERKV